MSLAAAASLPPTETAPSEALLSRARELHAEGRFLDARELARLALERREAEVGAHDLSLVPFLLSYAGLLYLSISWNAGRPHYERAQRLRGAFAPRPRPA
jgi:hypothetical protein